MKRIEINLNEKNLFRTNTWENLHSAIEKGKLN